MASRRKGRILAFQVLYAWDALGGKAAKRRRDKKKSLGVGDPGGGGTPGKAVGKGVEEDIPPQLLEFSWLGEEKQASLPPDLVDFARLLITGVVENIYAVDAMIRSHVQNWDFSRINRVDLAILRLSVYALMYQKDLPPPIIIDEAIGISREFGGGDSFRFINGVLDGVRRSLEAATAPPNT